LGGIDAVLATVRETVQYPLQHPEVYTWLGVPPPRGVLLHGPPGCGKTALAHAVAAEVGVPFLRVSAPEIIAGVSGESEAKIRDLFAAAAAAAPAIVFIDEVGGEG
jgi:ribosome biogenesis ATPase